MISFILEKIHDLIHLLKLPRMIDFAFMRIKIKWDNRKSKCWKCKDFNGFYFDEVTYECKMHGCSMWGDDVYCDCLPEDFK